jgi:glycosyltransferase involved in cell wall biosynthesis
MPFLRQSLESILCQVDESFEVIVVDSLSSDGSREVLQEYQKLGKLTLIEYKCSRGAGRQKALESSSGEYVISGLDMDDTFRRSLHQLLQFYHEKCEGKMLLTEIASTIAPRSLIERLGGWRDLQYNETWELCRRAANDAKYVWTVFPLIEETNKHTERRTAIGRARYNFVRAKGNWRVGHRVYARTEKITIGMRAVQLVAIISSFLSPRYIDRSSGFTIANPKDFVDSFKWWPETAQSSRVMRRYEETMKRQTEAKVTS